MAVEKRA